ncbi:sulfurtransferase complex subunit TusD [Congregibacter variabilis]|uniref:Sulfurtransferase complex subunit TusD n=1 Tax=Congregibacter variabilis TaxID=3081200 RepID=A0ABZ0I3U4_9GAMM|nr:sulfurtransferase complex subunit TusD [Congregibacter sp. IMCC43200]
MRYTLLVLSPPDIGPSARHALEFAKAVCQGGHEVACVFFYDAGVLTALSHCEPPADEDDLRSGWQSFAQSTGTPLVACVASAVRFGLGDGQTHTDRCLPEFTIAGLGALIESSSTSQRFLTFAD